MCLRGRCDHPERSDREGKNFFTKHFKELKACLDDFRIWEDSVVRDSYGHHGCMDMAFWIMQHQFAPLRADFGKVLQFTQSSMSSSLSEHSVELKVQHTHFKHRQED
eukprot:6460148-Amphidinium_carterae.2